MVSQLFIVVIGRVYLVEDIQVARVGAFHAIEGENEVGYPVAEQVKVHVIEQEVEAQFAVKESLLLEGQGDVAQQESGGGHLRGVEGEGACGDSVAGCLLIDGDRRHLEGFAVLVSLCRESADRSAQHPFGLDSQLEGNRIDLSDGFYLGQGGVTEQQLIGPARESPIEVSAKGQGRRFSLFGQGGSHGGGFLFIRQGETQHRGVGEGEGDLVALGNRRDKHAEAALQMHGALAVAQIRQAIKRQRHQGLREIDEVVLAALDNHRTECEVCALADGTLGVLEGWLVDRQGVLAGHQVEEVEVVPVVLVGAVEDLVRERVDQLEHQVAQGKVVVHLHVEVSDLREREAVGL